MGQKLYKIGLKWYEKWLLKTKRFSDLNVGDLSSYHRVHHYCHHLQKQMVGVRAIVFLFMAGIKVVINMQYMFSHVFRNSVWLSSPREWDNLNPLFHRKMLFSFLKRYLVIYLGKIKYWFELNASTKAYNYIKSALREWTTPISGPGFIPQPVENSLNLISTHKYGTKL